MLNQMTDSSITVTESAQAELKKLLADAGDQKPRIYLAGFG